MYKTSSIILALLLIIAVAACGDDDDTTTDDSQAPAAGVDQAASSGGGSAFSVTVTGAQEESYTQAEGSINYSVFDLSSTMDAPVKNELIMFEGGLDPEVGLRQVSLLIPQETEAGTYDLQGSTAMFAEGTFAASFSANSGTESSEYGQNVEGTFTLDSVDDDTISGSFEFTADSVDFNDAGETITETVEVSGEFSDVPLIGG